MDIYLFWFFWGCDWLYKVVNMGDYVCGLVRLVILESERFVGNVSEFGLVLVI